MTVILVGALLVVAGVVYMAGAALGRGRLSEPTPLGTATDRTASRLAAPTLEPRRRGLGFLGLSRNWPGLLMAGVGAMLLLSAML
ncbi:hypothetical protein RFM23_29475 [Mesorhizobium abyssinicae]|uniref:Uncharacterized protein n=1 Tax=Mesorhizobium abyssinicae TaxID=1209958 RepID=A0ABU5AWP2_9HYPH|nr:hypothetical protein [Mesorhizobium abyssinicae]MDX8541747.1 hypothetical protein [Mesorhizobium abyssinicae]